MKYAEAILWQILNFGGCYLLGTMFGNAMFTKGLSLWIGIPACFVAAFTLSRICGKMSRKALITAKK